MSEWFWYAIAAAILYGLHQVFTKLASERIEEVEENERLENSPTIRLFDGWEDGLSIVSHVVKEES